MEYSNELRVPKDRLAVLIGTKGSTKRKIEKATKTDIDVDSKEGIVTITSEDAMTVFVCQQVVKAISRGFSPEVALTLLRIDNVLEVINIADFVKNKGHLERVRGRVIGAEGRTRVHIEELTSTNITVYGKTVCVIGEAEHVSIARKAIETLLQGSPHSTVYRWLEKQKKILNRREFEEEPSDFAKDEVKEDFKEVEKMTDDL